MYIYVYIIEVHIIISHMPKCKTNIAGLTIFINFVTKKNRKQKYLTHSSTNISNKKFLTSGTNDQET